MKWRKRIRERDGAWRGECEIVGDGAPLVRAAETEKFPAGGERGKRVRERAGAGGETVGKIGKRETRVKTTQNAIDRDGESVDTTRRSERGRECARRIEGGGIGGTAACGGENGRVDSRASSSGSSGALALS